MSLDTLNDCCRDYFPVFGFGFFITSGLLLGFGFYYDLVPAITALIAIPLFPTKAELCDLYSGPGTSIRISDVYSEDIINITGRKSTTQRVWLVHNLWALNFSVLFASRNVTYERNMDGSEAQIAPSTLKLHDFLPDIFRESGRFRVYCGFSKRTGKDLGIGNACVDSPFPVMLNGDYEAIELTETTYYYRTREWNGDGYDGEWEFATSDLDFHWLSAKPKDFLDPPQLYFVSWGDDRPALLTMRIFGFITLAIDLVIVLWGTDLAFNLRLLRRPQSYMEIQ